jgi:hypothetical protein
MQCAIFAVQRYRVPLQVQKPFVRHKDDMMKLSDNSHLETGNDRNFELMSSTRSIFSLSSSSASETAFQPAKIK